MKIENLLEQSRPREKASRLGIESLTDVELLALLIAGGIVGHNAIEIANDMLQKAGSLSSLSTFSLPELMSFPGIGKTKAIQLQACFESFHRLKKGGDDFPDKCDKNTLHRYFHDIMKQQEEAILVLLSPSSKMLGYRLIYKGDALGMRFREEDVLREVLKSGNRRFVLIHNHPSGNSAPSIEDMKVAGRLDLAAKHLNVDMADFLIFGDKEAYSYKEQFQG